MTTRGTQFGRTMEYLRTADIDEARSALAAGERVVLERMQRMEVKPEVRRARVRKPKAPPISAEQLGTAAL